MEIKIGQQVDFIKDDEIIDGYVYGIHDGIYQIGYWDSKILREKIDTNVAESKITSRVCPFTQKKCGTISTNVNACKHCKHNKYMR